MPEFPHITDPLLQAYCREHSSGLPYISDQIETSSQNTGQYKMASGQYLGKFLQLMAQVIRPRRILELGTFTGYGTLCLREGLQKDGLIYTLEKSEEYFQLSKENFDAVPHKENIVQKLGDAAELISELDEELDLVFIDAAKRQYSHYFDLIFPKLKTGGVILADNVLWKGKVVSENNDSLGEGLDAFNKKIAADDRVDNILLPIDDGVNFIVKK